MGCCIPESVMARISSDGVSSAKFTVFWPPRSSSPLSAVTVLYAPINDLLRGILALCSSSSSPPSSMFFPLGFYCHL
ncbi:uncharacterized protein LOC111371452 isoform X2 [Olea europaea var. sylvestris]|uniref:Uncharacterized protein n=1 Tax=Olea europaea subsp. europaea TaxID=158383 RepID=A0A8S0S4T2_OLEEU|nr:uncharacterized protein LOC111371452 isoform X2 [Olea europaea var. sylvestris]CAA2986733.1 Hypothetical predicted protein [Olea europaea subsp. europaea]